MYLWHADKHWGLVQVDTIILGVSSQACPKYPKYKVCISLQYLQKSIGLKLIFCLQINTKVFYKLIVPLWVCIARHAQSTQNNKFSISFHYLKKKWSYEVGFLHADKHESFLQIDSIILMGMVKHSQSSQNSKLAISLHYLKKDVKDEVDFLHADKHQSFLKVYFNTLDIKVSGKVDIIISNGHDQAFWNYS